MAKKIAAKAVMDGVGSANNYTQNRKPTGSGGTGGKKFQIALDDDGYYVAKPGPITGTQPTSTTPAAPIQPVQDTPTAPPVVPNTAPSTAPNTAPPTGEVPPAQAVPDTEQNDSSYGDYMQSEAVKQASAILQQHQDNKPVAYQSQWQDQIDAAFDAYTNRDPFSYDINADALYQQYKDNYIQQGRMAMMDTMGQAAAMTGGYGNSYAQTVGQQAYNQQLNQLNDVVPQLYQMAYDRYDREGTDLYNQYNMLLARENKDYSRYQDSLSNWYKDLDYFTGRYDTERDLAYNEYLANLERDKAAAELMAGLGQYDRMGEVYGLTDGEVQKIIDANKPVYSGGNQNPTPNYTEMTRTDMKDWESIFMGAESIGDVEWYANQMGSEGYDPEEVAKWYDRYAGEFIPEQPQSKSGSWRDQDEYWRAKNGSR